MKIHEQQFTTCESCGKDYLAKYPACPECSAIEDNAPQIEAQADSLKIELDKYKTGEEKTIFLKGARWGMEEARAIYSTPRNIKSN